MATIDIRDNQTGMVDNIRYSNLSQISLYTTAESLVIETPSNEEELIVAFEDIDNIIKALEKAKELWS